MLNIKSNINQIIYKVNLKKSLRFIVLLYNLGILLGNVIIIIIIIIIISAI